MEKKTITTEEMKNTIERFKNSKNPLVRRMIAMVEKKATEVKTTKKVYVGCKNVLSDKKYTLRFYAGINENSKLYCRWDIPRESQLKANLVIPHWSGRL